MEKERIKSLDFLKGIAIFLVFLGHAINWCHPDAYNDRLFNYIYSFHMPLFMFISGYFSFKLINSWSDIKKKFYQLVVPIIAYSIVSGFILQGEIKVSKFLDILLVPENGLWFFQILFYVSVFYILANIIYNKGIARGLGGGKIILDVFYIIAMLIGFSVSSALAIYFKRHGIEEDLGTPLFSKHCVFYVAGILTRMHWDKIRRILLKVVWVSIPVWFILATFFGFEHRPTFIDNPNIVIDTAYYYITGFAGIITAMSLSIKFIDQGSSSVIVNTYTYLGTITLGLYAVHSAFLMKLVSMMILPLSLNYWISLIMVTVISLLLSILIVKILEKGSLSPQLFLGKMGFSK